MRSVDVLASMGAFGDADLREIAMAVERAGRGELSEKATLELIARVVRRRTEPSADIYQKPLG